MAVDFKLSAGAWVRREEECRVELVSVCYG